jgi:hypothetical protein
MRNRKIGRISLPIVPVLQAIPIERALPAVGPPSIGSSEPTENW